ncbi:putative disease resistance protein RGA3 [Hibiscus syriacus]|uniref:putative disease resistance protein RGA3 n=1 Tax=Hibiscus syriacus TaxID=106335 RepID=UPI0019229B19|nr:putative disease resistance protein RGA3 [Hibiscus syriacus]
MAEAIAFDIITGLITKLGSRALSQIGLWWNFKDDLDDLKRTVIRIQAVLLDAEERSVTSNLVKVWLDELKDALYDAEDLLDDVHTEVLRRDLMSGNKLTKEVRLFFSRSNQFAYGRKMASKIKAIKARFASIQSQTSELKLVERDLPVETPFMAKRRQQTHSFVRKDEIIGRDHDKAALLKLLLDREFQSEENVIMVTIVGMGGLGKTALAQFVYSHDEVKDHFELMMWVCVSDVFDVKTIVANIIKSVTNQAPDQNLEMDQLQKQLRNKIDGKKYLLVLDDVWEENGEKWFSLKKLLMGGAIGSRIIVTTRSHRVAKITSKCEPHVLKGLFDDDAWFLFKKVAFEQRSADSTNPAFVEVGKQIVKKCGGVPLVIRTIASTLSVKESENEWRSFKDNVLATIISQKDGEILPALKLSYDHLPHCLKHCFAYCRLYPKDHEINVKTLVQLWIAQGFVKQSESNQSLDEIGLDYFNGLAERGFFQEIEEDNYGGGMACKMHDLMHDLAELVAGRGSRILESNSGASEVDEICRRVSIDFSITPSFKGRKLQTLLHFPGQDDQNMSKATWDLIISNCRCLRVLELDDLNLEIVPRSIHKLKHLRYFDLSDNINLKILPKCICKLQNLQVLRLDWCQGIEKLPKKIGKLVNLTHLSFDGCWRLTHMPRGIGKLISLQTISMFVVDIRGSHGGADLSELEVEFRAANLKEKQHLHSLTLEWSSLIPEADDEEKSLEDLQPHPNLKELRGPSKFKHLPSFARLPYLQKLEILSLTELEYMDNSGPSARQGESKLFFQSLKSLTLFKCPNLKSWWCKRPVDDHKNDDKTIIGTSTLAFPCLSSLSVEDCPLTSMPLYPSLDDKLYSANTSSSRLKQTIQINTCGIGPSTSSLPLSKLKSFEVEHIEEMDTNMLDECLQNMTSLEQCRIFYGHFIKVSATVDRSQKINGLVQLKSLQIENCSGLRTLFPVFPHLTSLETLKISYCKELDLCADSIQTFQHHTSRLRSLHLESIPKCRHLPEWLQHLTNLQNLFLFDLPNLTMLPDEMRRLTNLKSLSIQQSHQLEERCRKGIGADWHKIAHIPYIWVNGDCVQDLLKTDKPFLQCNYSDVDIPKKLATLIFWIAYFQHDGTNAVDIHLEDVSSSNTLFRHVNYKQMMFPFASAGVFLRLTFCLSNAIVLRKIISQPFSNSSDSSRLAESDGR